MNNKQISVEFFLFGKFSTNEELEMWNFFLSTELVKLSDRSSTMSSEFEDNFHYELTKKGAEIREMFQLYILINQMDKTISSTEMMMTSPGANEPMEFTSKEEFPVKLTREIEKRITKYGAAKAENWLNSQEISSEYKIFYLREWAEYYIVKFKFSD